METIGQERIETEFRSEIERACRAIEVLATGVARSLADDPAELVDAAKLDVIKTAIRDALDVLETEG